MCKARDCHLLWSPINTHSTSNAKAILSSSNIQCIYDVILYAWADSTKESYSSRLLAFHIFCDGKSIPELECAPANPSVIAAFIATLTGSYSGSTADNYVCGIKAWHIIHGLTWVLNDTETDALLKVAFAMQPLHHRLANLHLETLQPHIPPPCCFHIKPSNVCKDKDQQGNIITNIYLPKTKSSASSKDINWTRQEGPSNPQAAFENHLEMNTPPICEYLLRNIPFNVIKVKDQWSSNTFLTYLHHYAQILAPYMQAQPLLHESFL
ncbi:hypothetical protein BS17DRAFT_793068 [Gyrodon lividus]|nr:hypothetical protein BS17DRAFT_793068 [Gyrodon lividus]